MTTTPQKNTFHWQDLSHSMNPSPSARLEYDNKSIIAYSWGINFSTNSPFAHTRIGKYNVAVTDSTLQTLREAEAALISHPLPKIEGQDNSSVLSFRFWKDGCLHNGSYAYSLGLSFNRKIFPLNDLYSHIVKSGEPLIGFYPSFTITQATEGFTFNLTITNTGKEGIVLSGPATWSRNVRMAPESHIIINGWQNNREFALMLTSRNLKNGKEFIDEIKLQPKQTVTLTFDIPYSEMTTTIVDSIKHISDGNYSFTGEMKLDILKPEEMKGRIFTYFDPIDEVHLHDQR